MGITTRFHSISMCDSVVIRPLQYQKLPSVFTESCAMDQPRIATSALLHLTYTASGLLHRQDLLVSG